MGFTAWGSLPLFNTVIIDSKQKLYPDKRFLFSIIVWSR